MVGSKVFAVVALMRQFPREVADEQALSALDGIVGLGVQLAGGMLIIPVLLLGGFPTQRLDDTLMLMTGADVHLWELDASIGPVISLTLVSALSALCVSFAKHRLARVGKNRAIAALAIAATAWVMIELTLAHGPIFAVLKQFPPFNSLHLNYRFAAVFILPFSIVGSVALDRWHPAAQHRWVAAVILLLTIAGPLTYLALPEEVHRRWFDVTQSMRDYERISSGERFVVKSISSRPDNEAFMAEASSAVPYEPIFGYDLETFRPKFREGDVGTDIEGHLNMTNPASLVFPELTSTKPFDLISSLDRINFDRFRSRERPDWKLPTSLVWLNWLSVTTLFVCVSVLIVDRWRRVRMFVGDKPSLLNVWVKK